ncbi:MAG: hypothetical protein L0219_02565 [Phycisphaerales bacterium]|nr:hypothetical protein [Phycisphaerales bacterium]MCI0674263.1 hypothetical protein [Phycisphaerales bacterium]
MTKLLKKAFDEASKLEGEQQDAIARWLLDEIASERRWDRAFAESQNELAELADEALAEHRKNKTRPLDPESL